MQLNFQMSNFVLSRLVLGRNVSVRSFTRSAICFEASESKVNNKLESKKTEKQMSSAMRMYLTRKREHDAFIAKERAEFDMGKKHLANIMGLDPDIMTQDDIDKSVQYLFPSGLAPEAKPMMKPPEEIFPKQKDMLYMTIEVRPLYLKFSRFYLIQYI